MYTAKRKTTLISNVIQQMGERYVGKIGSDQTARNTATKIRKKIMYAIKRQVRSSVRKTGLVKIAPCIAEKMIVELAIEIQE